MAVVQVVLLRRIDGDLTPRLLAGDWVRRPFRAPGSARQPPVRGPEPRWHTRGRAPSAGAREQYRWFAWLILPLSSVDRSIVGTGIRAGRRIHMPSALGYSSTPASWTTVVTLQAAGAIRTGATDAHRNLEMVPTMQAWSKSADQPALTLSGNTHNITRPSRRDGPADAGPSVSCFLCQEACPHGDRCDDLATTHREPEARVFRRLGRLGARRHGFVHLCPGARPRPDGAVAELRHRGHAGQYWRLRRHPFRAVPARMGRLHGVGTDQRPDRARARADADDPLLFVVYISLRVRHQHLAARDPALLLWYRDRRRAADRGPPTLPRNWTRTAARWAPA